MRRRRSVQPFCLRCSPRHADRPGLSRDEVPCAVDPRRSAFVYPPDSHRSSILGPAPKITLPKVSLSRGSSFRSDTRRLSACSPSSLTLFSPLPLAAPALGVHHNGLVRSGRTSKPPAPDFCHEQSGLGYRLDSEDRGDRPLLAEAGDLNQVGGLGSGCFAEHGGGRNTGSGEGFLAVLRGQTPHISYTPQMTAPRRRF